MAAAPHIVVVGGGAGGLGSPPTGLIRRRTQPKVKLH